MAIDRCKKSTGVVKHDLARALEEMRQRVAEDAEKMGKLAKPAPPVVNRRVRGKQSDPNRDAN